MRVPQDVASFLAPHPVDFLPIPHGIQEELHRFGLHTLGGVAAMKAEALIDRFGSAGQKAWDLSQGRDNTPLAPLKQEESVAEHLDLPFASASLELLLTAVDTLLSRAYSRPGMQGRTPAGWSWSASCTAPIPGAKNFKQA